MRPLLALTVACALQAGCGFLDEDAELDAFAFEEATHGVPVEAGVDATGLGGGISLLGQLNTPTPCYRLRADLDHSGSQLTLRVHAQRTNNTCETILGNFRYEGAIGGLPSGTYQLRILHTFDVADWAEQQFNLSITVR